MREILFRGKRTSDEKWIQGSLCTTLPSDSECYEISYFDEDIYYTEEDVIPETIGQYTGLTDKNGTKIFEGDIVRTDKGKIYEIKMQKGCWIVWNDKAKMTYDKWDFLNTFAPTIEVIGNLHNNPELLKDG